jgi:dihydropteroate synthase
MNRSPATGRPSDRAVVMGVVNVTADSFSDGGRYLAVPAAVERGLALIAAGADLIDVGGESTRPGAHRVSAEVEAARVVPVVGALAAQGVRCSVDTTRAEVAAAAVAAGARIVNDVSGGLADPEMAAAVADAGVAWILMHWRGHSAFMDDLAVYDDVVDDVRRELSARVEAALAAGVREDAIVLDPGLGFAKTAEHNWALLRALPSITGLTGPGWGLPVLVGASRKRFLGTLLADAAGPRPPAGREAATTVISGLAAAAGSWGVRVHEAADSLDAVRVAAAITGRGPVRRLDLERLCHHSPGHNAPADPVTGGADRGSE